MERARARRYAGIAVVALVVMYVARWPFRSRYLYEWDSAQYALGTLEFDIYKHQPHPPGYPVWIVILKGLHLFISDLNTVQVFAAFVTSAGAGYVFYRFASSVHGEAVALVATACVVFNPLVVVASVTANTYPIDLFGSVGLAWLAARMWNGDRKVAPLTWALVALMAGVRQTGAVMLVPVVAASAARACRLDWRTWTKSALAGAVVFVSWYVPVAQMHGGIAKLQTYQTMSARFFFSSWSYFHGAPAWAHRKMLLEAQEWVVMMVGPAIVLAIAVYLGGVVAGRSTDHSDDSAPQARLRIGPLFFVLWFLPNAVMCALHCPKPGYFLGSLPPIALACASLVSRGMDRIGPRLRVSSVTLGSALALVAAAGSMTLASVGYDGVQRNRVSLAGVRRADDGTIAVLDAVGRDAASQDTTLVIVVGRSMWFGPNYRTLQVVLDAELWMFEFADYRRTSRHHVEEKRAFPTHVIPDRIRRIVWVHDAHLPLAAPILEGFEGTQEVASTPTSRVWVSDIGTRKIDVSFPVWGFDAHVAR